MIDTDDVLNPVLKRALEMVLGPVRVVKKGRELEKYYHTDTARQSSHLKVTRHGEMYVADCPFCHDRKMRLGVSYILGVRDEEAWYTKDNDQKGFSWNWEHWKCFNEECQSNPDHRREFREKVFAAIKKVRSASYDPDGRKFAWHVKPGTSRPRPALEPVEFPGMLVPVNELPADHPAAAYLRGRKFDPGELAREWDVSYAAHVPARTRGAMAQGRIIVPVYWDGAMVGWQARYPGDLDWKVAGFPKYLTYFPKSLVVYGLDEADDAEVVVLVEGVTDVWRYGRGAVCGLGKGLSAEQVSALAPRLKDRPLVLIPDRNDPESEPAFFRAAADLRKAGYAGPVSVAVVPPGKDPAAMTRPALRALVERTMAAMMV